MKMYLAAIQHGGLAAILVYS